jgi:hypothetical protein
MKIGSIVFGPNLVTDVGSASGYQVDHRLNIQNGAQSKPCNCIGPQSGQTKCPCKLIAESEQGRLMIRDGVVINGQRYRLIPE